MSISEADYVFLPLKDAVTPQKVGFFQHYVDAWWAVHPERGLAFFNPPGRRRSGGRRLGAPQCNTDERVTRMVAGKTMAELWPDVRIERLPSVWVPIDISDYRD